MKQIAKWLVAIVATIAAFGAASWICGELILPAVMKNSGIRWGLAGALGVAVAALAAMWGLSFAATGRSSGIAPSDDSGAPAEIAKAGSGDTRNKISGGTFHGPVIQGRDMSGPYPLGTTPLQSPDSETRD